MARYRVATDLTEAGQQPCARGERCAGRRTVLLDGEYVIVPAPTYTAFCWPDRQFIINCLGDLPPRYAELGARIGDRGGAPAGAPVSGGGGTKSRPNINLSVEAWQAHIVEILVGWEERVRDQVPGLSPIEGRRRRHIAVKDAARTLANHVDVLLALPEETMRRTTDISRWASLPAGATGVVHPAAGWIEYNTEAGGVAAGEEILQLHYRSLARLGQTPQHHDLLTPCWECDTPRLRRWDGSAGLSDIVVCRNCMLEYVGEDLARLMEQEQIAQRRSRRTLPAQPGPEPAALAG